MRKERDRRVGKGMEEGRERKGERKSKRGKGRGRKGREKDGIFLFPPCSMFSSLMILPVLFSKCYSELVLFGYCVFAGFSFV